MAMIMNQIFMSDGLEGLVSVEYSQGQDKLHIDEVERALSMNNEGYITDVDWDWRLIGLFKTRKEASEYCFYLREKYRLASADPRNE